MATFTTRFLGCKVSFADARRSVSAARRRPRRGRRARARSRSSTRAASPTRRSSKSRQAASRAARDGTARLRHGLRRESRGAPSPGCRRTSSSSPDDRGRRRRVRRGRCRSDRLRRRPTHGLDRVRAFVKIQDGCSFSCDFCVIPLVRGGTRSRAAEAVLGEIRRRVAPGTSRDRAHGRQPRLLPRPGGGYTLRGSSARRARRPGSSGCGSPRSRSTT